MLLLNVNNTFTKHARWLGSKFSGVERKATEKVDKEWLVSLRRANERVICASVVPSKTKELQTVFAKNLLLIHPELDLGRLKLNYPGFKTLGADRLSALVAAAHEFEGERIVVDCGTAVTVNVLTSDHAFIGGMIAPGLRLFSEYLPSATAQLPAPKLRKITKPIGKNTQDSVDAGVNLGFEGMVWHLVQTAATAAEFQNFHVILTGGDAKRIASALPFSHSLDETLSLRGLVFLSRFNP